MKKNMFIGLLAIVLVFGIMAVGCDNNITDCHLNGTWSYIYEWEDDDGQIHLFEAFLVLTNGSFELRDRSVKERGTYTTDNGILTLNLTHIFTFTNTWFVVQYGVAANRWYSKTELRNAFNMSDSEFEEEGLAEWLNDWFDEPMVFNYSIDGNSLNLGGMVLTRK